MRQHCTRAAPHCCGSNTRCQLSSDHAAAAAAAVVVVNGGGCISPLCVLAETCCCYCSGLWAERVQAHAFLQTPTYHLPPPVCSKALQLNWCVCTCVVCPTIHSFIFQTLAQHTNTHKHIQRCVRLLLILSCAQRTAASCFLSNSTVASNPPHAAPYTNRERREGIPMPCSQLLSGLSRFPAALPWGCRGHYFQ